MSGIAPGKWMGMEVGRRSFLSLLGPGNFSGVELLNFVFYLKTYREKPWHPTEPYRG